MTENYQQAALRHLSDTEALAKIGRIGNAGYLIGYTAECALKHRFPNLSKVHFPEMRDHAKKRLDQRRDAPIRLVLEIPDLMVGWSTNLRYYENAFVTEATWVKWHNHAVRILRAVGIERGAE